MNMYGNALKIHPHTPEGTEINNIFQFACPGAVSGADFWWKPLVPPALVLWAYPSGLALLAS